MRILLTIAASLLFLPPVRSAELPEKPTFHAHIRPIFQAYCTECHGEEARPKGKLDLRLRRLTLAGGMSGPSIVIGKPNESYLIDRVVSGEMPPGKKKLTKDQIEMLKRWIATGATVESEEPETVSTGYLITKEDRDYWAYQPITKPTPPNVKAANPIDRFLLPKLLAKGLNFNPPADRATLIRRITFDLHGLPPTQDEVQAFVSDPSPNAYEKLIDRLLASPQYGERWARHWLDVAGYADSEGGSPKDPVRNTAWKYRDYVIRSYNADKPFDTFIHEQLAGDELLPRPIDFTKPDQVEKLTATGFLRLAADGSASSDVDQKLARNQVLTDTVKIVSSTFLGLTVGCAECHNHRYDPIPQTDFYRLRAFLEPTYNLKNWKVPASREVSLITPQDRAKSAAIEVEAKKLDAARIAKMNTFIDATFDKEVAKLPENLREAARISRKTPAAKRTAEQKKLMQQHPSLNVSSGSLYLYDPKAAAELKKMQAEATKLRETKPKEEFIRAMMESAGQVPQTFLFQRGDPDQPGEVVAPGGLTILDSKLPLVVPAKPLANGSSGRRLALAQWLTDPRHPLTSRVLVNRFWMHHFGRGLVGTPGDFGRLGEKLIHPELLDWLASEFVSNGWSLKHLHRQILTSQAYRQSSVRSAKSEAVDPDNHLLGRYPVRRLEAEEIRDAVLAVSGSLNPKTFGPPVPVRENESGQFELGNDNRDGAGRFEKFIPLAEGEAGRRSIYVQVRRSRPLADLDTFDWAVPEPNCVARAVTTSTPQSLMMMNGEFVIEQSVAFADRVIQVAGTDPKQQVATAWTLAFGTAPTEIQQTKAMQFLAEETKIFAKQPKSKTDKTPAATQALATFCQALLASNRFLYLD